MTRTWPPLEWTFVEPDEEALRNLPKPPEITDELRRQITDYRIKRRANRFAADNGKPLPYPELEAIRND